MNRFENILILGLGGMGYHLARRLSREGHQVTVMEPDFHLVQRAEGELDVRLICGDAMKFSCWALAGAKEMDCVIAVTNSDAINVLAAQIADQFGIPQKITRLRSFELWDPDAPLTAETFKIDLVIRPEELAAQEIFRLLKSQAGNMLVDVDEGRLQVAASHITRRSPFANVYIRDISQRFPKTDFQIVCVARDIETLIPGGDFELLPDDHVFILASREVMPRLLELAGVTEAKRHDVLIVGGGRIGTRVAQLLESLYPVRLIERDERRAEHLSHFLRKTECLHGDGCDRDTLLQAGLLGMDTVITATGDNETNIMTGVLAKHLIKTRADDRHAEIGKTIAVVSREDHLVLASAMGTDIAVNKKILAANEVLRYIRRGHVLSVAHLHGCEAEAVELLADPDAPITRKPLHRMNLQGRIMIGAVFRDGQWTIARGSTQIEAGDRVVCVCGVAHLRELQSLFLS